MGDVRKNYVSRKRMNRCIKKVLGNSPIKKNHDRKRSLKEEKGALGKPQDKKKDRIKKEGIALPFLTSLI